MTEKLPARTFGTLALHLADMPPPKPDIVSCVDLLERINAFEGGKTERPMVEAMDPVAMGALEKLGLVYNSAGGRLGLTQNGVAVLVDSTRAR